MILNKRTFWIFCRRIYYT